MMRCLDCCVLLMKLTTEEKGDEAQLIATPERCSTCESSSSVVAVVVVFVFFEKI